RRQARNRPGVRRGGPSRHAARPVDRGDPDQADVPGPRLLPAGALRVERAPLPPAEVPDDVPGGRGEAPRGLPFEPDVAPGLQGLPGPAADGGRAGAPPALDRRAAAALERDPGRHEPRGTQAAAARGGGPLRAVAAPPALDEAGPDMPVAGLG